MATPLSATLESVAFSIVENPGVYAFLLGSGVSMGAGIPTGWDITQDLIRRVALQKGVADQSDWANWYRKSAGKEPNYSSLLEDVADTPAERRAIIEKYIEPTQSELDDQKKTPTKAHRAVAELVRDGWVKVVITTNFDRLIETALRDVGVEPTIVHSPDAAKGAEPLSHAKCFLLKLHGDYKDIRILNTSDELKSYEQEVDRLLDRILDEYGLVVCGWSGTWDHALRNAMTRAPNRRYGGVWASRSETSSEARELIESRKFREIRIKSADEFLGGLAHQVAAAKKLMRRAPYSVDLMLASAKRFLSRPEHRIDLSDLVNDELDRYHAATLAIRTKLDEPLTNAGFQERIEQYEVAAEALCKLFCTLGRFGSDDDLKIAQDGLVHLAETAFRTANGLLLFSEMRVYPVMLIFAALCLGLLRSSRSECFAKLMTTTIASKLPARRRAVDQLLLPTEQLGDAQIWNQLMGTRWKAPFHLRLFEALKRSVLTILAPMSDLTPLFVKYEVYGAFSYLLLNSTKSEVTSALEDPQQRFVWTPIGMSIWEVENRNLALETLGQVDHIVIATALRKLPQWPDIFDDFKRSFEGLASRLRWR